MKPKPNQIFPNIKVYLSGLNLQQLSIHIAYWLISLLLFLYAYSFIGSLKQGIAYTIFSIPLIMAAIYLVIYWVVPKYLFNSQVYIFSLITLAIFLTVLNLQTMMVIANTILLPELADIDVWATPYDLTFMILTTFVVSLPVFLYETLRNWDSYRSLATSLKKEHQELIASLKDKNGHISVRSEGKTQRINICDIRYIESYGDYSHIHLPNSKIISRITLKELEDLSEELIRVHRSYIINTTYCQSFSTQEVIIDDTEIPIGRSYKKSFRDYLKQSGIE